jgi:AcrR family transcriptional regulator
MVRPLSETARDSMISSAREVIATAGVHSCTVDEIARRTGIAKTTIYRHFGGMDALVLAAVDGMVKATDVPNTGSLFGDLRVIVVRYLKIARSPANRELFGWMLTRSMQDQEFAAMFRPVRIQPHGPTVIALQRAMARGEVDPTLDVHLAIHLIQGPFMSKRTVENEELTQHEIDTLLGQIVRGLTIGPT